MSHETKLFERMKIGDRYKIRNHTIGGCPIDEGEATLVGMLARCDQDPSEFWLVRLDEEPTRVVARHVFREDKIED
jgi:hypothetical protein